MKTLLRTTVLGVVLVLAWSVLGPYVMRGTDTQARGPQDVTLEVSWKATTRLPHAQVLWAVGPLDAMACAADTPENAAGGYWRRDIVLAQDNQEYVFNLTACVVPYEGTDGAGKKFRQATPVTCSVTTLSGRKADTSTAAPGDSCSVTKRVDT